MHTDKEIAFLWAEFVARLEELHPGLPLPANDDVVNACLDHVGEPLRRDDENPDRRGETLRHRLTDTRRFDLIYERRISAIVS
ncbi:hypothetical protein JNUCC0626_33085 [Lentzea sp. JNUCC 0626]|uniref:hypothetical protein n=1 Tax=Lentzea sp. JNUCC 0626 TaxID=3367513 RepID=UPI00374A300E